MKKVCKVLTLVLVVALLCATLSGCALFSKNGAKYRQASAITVGEQSISVGKVLDTFNNYYNNYYSYVSQGYVTVDYLFNMAIESLVGQYSKVDEYVSANTPATHQFASFCANAGYLTEEEMKFAIDYIKYVTFTSFDSAVLEKIGTDYELEEAKKDDTSRDFAEVDDLQGKSLSAYTYAQNVSNKEMTEYYTKYYANVQHSYTADLAGYVYASETDSKAIVDEINARIKGEDKITHADYVAYQQKVFNQYQRSIKQSYDVDLEQFVVNQVEDFVVSLIVAKHNYGLYQQIDSATQLTETLAKLQNNVTALATAQKTGYKVDDSTFVSFIEALGATSYIYDVPAGYDYIFVKNILVPFSESQKTQLSNLERQVGGTTSEEYLEVRNQLASQIVAEDFVNKDEQGNNAKVENLFALQDGKLVVNPSGALGEIFLADGSVNATDKDAKVIELMKQYNTDVAQHKAQYDYVVRVGEVPSSYTAKWVPEFVQAANQAHQKGVGSYALAISTYGVHIVYYSADVTAQTFDFATNYLDTTKPEYRIFKSYFESQSSILLEESAHELQDSYVNDGKVNATKAFERFLADNGIVYDLKTALKHDHDHDHNHDHDHE